VSFFLNRGILVPYFHIGRQHGFFILTNGV